MVPQLLSSRVIMFRYTCVLLFLGMAHCVVPKIRMNDGRLMPAIALGTYLGVQESVQTNNSLLNAVLHAIDVGYRHFDTAAIYHTEGQLGAALRRKIEERVVKREEVFVTTKLWNTHHARNQVPKALRASLDRLGLSYVDLYLMHWPIGLHEDYTFSPVDFMETWRGMEDVHRQGLARSIGVSNFNITQIERVLKEGAVKPAALQIEVHPQIIQADLVSFCRQNDIIVMGYSPLGTLVPRYGIMLPGVRENDSLLMGIARKYGKTVAQVLLRWSVDRNVVPLPKTVTPKRLKENIDIFDFKLTEEDINQINSFNANYRTTFPSFWQEHPYYPFEKVENPIPDPFIQRKIL